MKKIIIFGNSGSGKSTLAKSLCETEQLAHLDLDTIAWLPGMPPQRKPLADSQVEIEAFVASHSSWVIEGCYSDLLEMVLPEASEIIFLNLPVALCIENAKARPWEPHKYESKEAQDANLDMLISWIADYETRQDTFSQAAHQALFDLYQGRKVMLSKNEKINEQI